MSIKLNEVLDQLIEDVMMSSNYKEMESKSKYKDLTEDEKELANEFVQTLTTDVGELCDKLDRLWKIGTFLNDLDEKNNNVLLVLDAVLNDVAMVNNNKLKLRLEVA